MELAEASRKMRDFRGSLGTSHCFSKQFFTFSSGPALVHEKQICRAHDGFENVGLFGSRSKRESGFPSAEQCDCCDRPLQGWRKMVGNEKHGDFKFKKLRSTE